jgi:hypothetical protein
MSRILALIIYLLFFVTGVVAQANNVYGSYLFRGVVMDENSYVIPGLLLNFRLGEKYGATITNINGNFEMRLSEGNYEITSATDKQFRAFIRITRGPLNPQDVQLILDSTGLCRTKLNGVDFPTVLRSSLPVYPSAAQAVRAFGTVTVDLTVDSQGNVVSAKAVSGHLLLRTASEIAAEKFLFEKSNLTSPRKVILDFIYTLSNEKRADLKRYDCPYRIIVPSAPDLTEKTRQSS